jgi:hypothetical protein
VLLVCTIRGLQTDRWWKSNFVSKKTPFEPSAMAEFRFCELRRAGTNVMRWISTFDRYDLILAAAVSGFFAVALSLGFI